MMSLFIGGFTGQLLGGALNDRLHRYKLIILISYCGSSTMVGLFFYVSTYGYLVGDIVIAAVVGFLMQGIIPIMYGFCGELVYPEPESTSTAINLICKSSLNLSKNLSAELKYFRGLNGLGVIVLEIFKLLFKHFGIVWSCVFLGFGLVIGLILLIFTEEKLERQDAEKDPDPISVK